MPDGAVVSLDTGVLLGLAGLDMQDGNPMFLGPFHQFFTDVFRVVVHPDRAWLATPFDDPVQAANDPFGWQREIHFDAQPFAVEVVQHVQQPECTTIAEAISHEVHRPGQIGGLGHRQCVGFVPLQPLARLDGKVQFQFAVIPVNSFVVPQTALDIAKV